MQKVVSDKTRHHPHGLKGWHERKILGLDPILQWAVLELFSFECREPILCHWDLEYGDFYSPEW